MRTFVLAKTAVVGLTYIFSSSVVFAQNSAPTTSTDTVRSRTPPDGAVKADPAPKPSQVGQSSEEFHKKVKTKPAAPPPAPPTTSTTTKKSN